MTPSTYSRINLFIAVSITLTTITPFLILPHAYAANIDPISSMEKQIRAMQSQLSDMKRHQAAENKRIRAELKQQREIIEENPYNVFSPPLNPTLSLPPSIFGYGRNTLRNKNYFNINSNILAPPRTASTPYGEINATPPDHPDLYGPLRRGQLQLGDIRITLGGYLEVAVMWRSRYTGSDITTGFNAIPWKNNSFYHMSKFHQSER